MTEHLYRNIARYATLVCVLFMIGHAAAQAGRRYQPPAGPRALGLLQIAPNGAARLVPILYYENGKYLDARFYRANPAPLVLETDIVYEAQKTGASEGLFTVNRATNLDGRWYGLGKWSSAADLVKKVEKPKESITAPVRDGDDERPVLRRPGAKKEDKPADAAKSPDITAKADGKAPPPETEDDPDRPRMKRPSTTESAKAAAPAQVESRVAAEREPPDDPDRPRLRRGKPVQKQSEEIFPGMSPKEAAPGAKPTAPTTQFKTYVAVSDAKSEAPRPYEFQWNEAERKKHTEAIAKLAAAELAKYAAARKIVLPKKLDGKTDVRAFDVDYSNTPEIVFTGIYPVAADSSGRPNDIYVTYVARVGYEDKLEKVFSTVTDSRYLDATSRLELIDAVDVEGDGRGELLFREYTGDGQRYAIYRSSAYEMRRIFAGGSGE
jgi:hypothetical protein